MLVGEGMSKVIFASWCWKKTSCITVLAGFTLLCNIKSIRNINAVSRSFLLVKILGRTLHLGDLQRKCKSESFQPIPRRYILTKVMLEIRKGLYCFSVEGMSVCCVGAFGTILLMVLHGVKNLQHKGRTWRYHLIKLSMPLHKMECIEQQQQKTQNEGCKILYYVQSACT